jgi:hypothetical protein
MVVITFGELNTVYGWTNGDPMKLLEACKSANPHATIKLWRNGRPIGIA